MENDILKQAAPLLGKNLNKEKDVKLDEDEKLIEEIKEIFRRSRNNYGTRKIKKELWKIGYKISRRKIGRIMKKNGLVSNYTVAQYKVIRSKCNEEDIPNLLNR